MQMQQQQAAMNEQNAMMQAEQDNQPGTFDEEVGGLPGPMQEMYKKLPPEAKAAIMRQATGQ
jgi:predicted alpha-1,6-mannanase (GH76 family)